MAVGPPAGGAPASFCTGHRAFSTRSGTHKPKTSSMEPHVQANSHAQLSAKASPVAKKPPARLHGMPHGMAMAPWPSASTAPSVRQRQGPQLGHAAPEPAQAIMSHDSCGALWAWSTSQQPLPAVEVHAAGNRDVIRAPHASRAGRPGPSEGQDRSSCHPYTVSTREGPYNKGASHTHELFWPIPQQWLNTDCTPYSDTYTRTIRICKFLHTELPNPSVRAHLT